MHKTYHLLFSTYYVLYKYFFAFSVLLFVWGKKFYLITVFAKVKKKRGKNGYIIKMKWTGNENLPGTLHN